MNRYNSTFRIKESRLKRSPMVRTRKRMKKAGRRTNDWRRAWRFLKPEFNKREINFCEFSFIPHQCRGPLDPAHSKKRNKMEGNDIYAVALACRRIHDYLDYECTHEEMESFVMRAINNRGGLILPERKAA